MLSFVETDVISEIVLTKNNSEILKLKNQYKTQFGQDLEDIIESRLFTNFKNILKIILKANRSEVSANQTEAVLAARELQKKNKETFYKIFSTYSFKQILLIDENYKNFTGHFLNEVIEIEFSSWWWDKERQALLTICKVYFEILLFLLIEWSNLFLNKSRSSHERPQLLLGVTIE